MTEGQDKRVMTPDTLDAGVSRGQGSFLRVHVEMLMTRMLSLGSSLVFSACSLIPRAWLAPRLMVQYSSCPVPNQDLTFQNFNLSGSFQILIPLSVGALLPS